MLFKDARDYQIIFLSLFLFLGISTRDWTLRVDLMLVVVLTCLSTQIFLSQLNRLIRTRMATDFPLYENLTSSYRVLESLLRRETLLTTFRFFQFLSTSSLKSALITTLGLCLLLRGNDYQTMAIAGGLAIASKFIFRVRGKHFFNPANFGIISALVLTNDAWVSPGQWGADGWYLLLFIGTGGMILSQVGRWDTSVAFLGVYISLEIIRNVWLGWTWDVLQHQLMSGSLLLFAFFMITDPRSIPNATISRLIWATSIAMLTFMLQHIFYVPTAMFWALFVLSPVTVLLDTTWIAPRFSWRRSFANIEI